MNPASGFPGAVLAGGQSRRMGTNKALMEIDGKPLIRLVAEVLKEVCSEVIIVGGNKKDLSAFGLHWYADVYPDCGPLGGIYTALQQARTDVVIAACDLPNISSDLLRFLLSNHNSEESRNTVLRSGPVIQPLLGVYHSASIPLLRHFLERGRRKVLEFLGESPANIIDIRSAPHAFSPELLLNLNTMDEYRFRVTK